MPPHPRLNFREQAEGALVTFAGTVAYLLFVVGRDTEVRTEGDRVLVVVCTIGAIAMAAVVLVVVTRGALRRRRGSEAAAGRADAPQVDGPADEGRS